MIIGFNAKYYIATIIMYNNEKKSPHLISISLYAQAPPFVHAVYEFHAHNRRRAHSEIDIYVELWGTCRNVYLLWAHGNFFPKLSQ